MGAARPQKLDRCWKVTVSFRASGKDFDSMLVIASDLEEATSAVLEHCSGPGLDLEVTAVERLPSGVITRKQASKRGRAA